ncbi:hypothetical protein ACTWQB_10130 [Piscibacillus sp. B03]|uniref:hypothetical protein n=1 Tax=Piscibacillus sp. B03 TaxID=3457430 RepID=UPI003FCCB260
MWHNLYKWSLLILVFVMVSGGLFIGTNIYMDVNDDTKEIALEQKDYETLTIEPLNDEIKENLKPKNRKVKPVSSDIITHSEYRTLDDFVKGLKKSVNGKTDHPYTEEDLHYHIGSFGTNYTKHFLALTEDAEEEYFLYKLLEKTEKLYLKNGPLSDEERVQAFNELKTFVNQY